MKRRLLIAFALCLLVTGCATNSGEREVSHILPASQSAPIAQRADGETIPLAADGQTARPAQSVVYDAVEIRRYTGEGVHPYAHSVISNHTDKAILGQQFAMLAYDREGNPLKIKWVSTDSSARPAYYFLCHWGSEEIAAGATKDTFGGWSLNIGGADPEAEKIAYILYCDMEITFADGTVWTNPQFEDWRAAYEGKAVAVQQLEAYYPYVQEIILP